MFSYKFQTEVVGRNLVVSADEFCAVYYKPLDQPKLVLRLRTKSGDYELLAKASDVANEKARELGWIT